MVVFPDGSPGGVDEFSESGKALRIAEIDLELGEERLLEGGSPRPVIVRAIAVVASVLFVIGFLRYAVETAYFFHRQNE